MNYFAVTPEEIKAAKRAYLKEWRANNKDKVRQHNYNYWAKKAAELKAKKGEENERN
jgi:hypothetical protein